MIRPSEEALTYLGEQEKPGNSGFINPAFEAEMREEGWQKGWAWCCVFVRVIYVNCYPERAAELRKLISPGTVQTFRNFRDAAYLIGNVPQKDSLVIWQSYKNGKPLTTGHAAIVYNVIDQDNFESIEGNSNNGGSREGFEVVRKKRIVNFNTKNGLRLLGFIQISPTSTPKI